jgi:hypothetical protein
MYGGRPVALVDGERPLPPTGQETPFRFRQVQVTHRVAVLERPRERPLRLLRRRDPEPAVPGGHRPLHHRALDPDRSGQQVRVAGLDPGLREVRDLGPDLHRRILEQDLRRGDLPVGEGTPTRRQLVNSRVRGHVPSPPYWLLFCTGTVPGVRPAAPLRRTLPGSQSASGAGTVVVPDLDRDTRLLACTSASAASRSDVGGLVLDDREPVVNTYQPYTISSRSAIWFCRWRSP